MTRTEPALTNARTPMTQALQAIAVIPLNPSTHGARNKRTPSINGRYSIVGFHRKSSDPAPKTKSKTPPTYAVQAAAVCEVSPKTNGVMKRTTPNSALIQSCQRISPDIANQPPGVVVADDVKLRLSQVLRTVLTSNEIRNQREVLLRVGRAHPAVDPWRAAEQREEFVHRQLLWHDVTSSVKSRRSSASELRKIR